MNTNQRISSDGPDRGGFILPAVLFVLVIISVLSVAALSSSADERRSGRALRESGVALYVAEAGKNLILSDQAALNSLAKTLTIGASADLGWSTLPDGASYRAVLARYDAGGQPSYILSVEGRGATTLGGQHTLEFSLTSAPPIPITAAIKGGSSGEEVDIRDFATASGEDTIPVNWGGVCNDPLSDVAGVEWATSAIDLDGGDSYVEGSPPSVVNGSLVGQDLFDWGTMDFDDLAAMSDITVPSDDWAGGIAPSASGGVCNTAAAWNWGDPYNPAGPCFDYFPIIHWDGGGSAEFRIRDHAPGEAYGQGILLIDGHLRIEDDFEFYGVVLVKGEVRFEAQDGAANHIFGGLIGGEQVRIEDGDKMMRYSQCAVNRALAGITSVVPLASRAWNEVLR